MDIKRRSIIKGLAVSAILPKMSFSSESHEQKDKCDSKHESGGKFTRSSRVRSGMALGGIGTGSIEIRKNGCFYNWSIFNNFPKETGPELRLPVASFADPTASSLFFKVRYQIEGEEPRLKLLEIPDDLNEGGQMGIAYYFPWMEAIESIDYSARFPFAKLVFSDEEMPFDVLLEAWSPFIPHDVKNSSLPVVFFDFKVSSKTNKKVSVMLMMSARNLVGYDTFDKYYLTDVKRSGNSTTVSMSCGGMDEKASNWGQIAIASISPHTTYYCGWSSLHPYYEYVLRHHELPDLDATDGPPPLGHRIPDWLPLDDSCNVIDPSTGKKIVKVREFDPDSRLFCTLARTFELNGLGSSQDQSFVYGWNFPNLYAAKAFRKISDINEGHYYSNFFKTASDVAEYAVLNRDDLHKRSTQFQQNFFDSSAETFVLEQINSQLNTFVTSGRLVKSGSFGILEGLASTWSWGPIATIDVMLYGSAPIIALFPELQKESMRCHSKIQNDKGQLTHGLEKHFPVAEGGPGTVSERIDIPGDYALLVLRDFFWSNDRAYLEELYPSIKLAVNYILEHQCLGTEPVPVMRGIPQESSYDNFPMYGYASYLTSQWLCVLAGAARAAEVMKDSAASAQYQTAFEKAQATMDKQLWNDRYYRLYNDEDRRGGKGGKDEGCLSDQLIGQWMAHSCGLGYLTNKERVATALKSIMRENYKPAFGLRNCSWPGGSFWSDVPRETWVDQANTCWSGVELGFASFLLYEGYYADAMSVIRTVDERYRKNGLYWDHQEFGGHYFRAMSAWSILNGLLGLSVNQGRLRFSPKLREEKYKLFFALPSGTAHYSSSGSNVVIRCLTGELAFSEIGIVGTFHGGALLDGSELKILADNPGTEDGMTTWRFAQAVRLGAGKEIVLS